MRQQRMFEEFNNQYMIGHKTPSREELKKAAHLMLDEVKEVFEELYDDVEIEFKLKGPKKKVNLKRIAKEMADTRYITGERMVMLGFQLDAIEAEVHRSNMSKVVPYDKLQTAVAEALPRYPNVLPFANKSGSVILRCMETGKVVKPESFYSPAKVTDKMIP